MKRQKEEAEAYQALLGRKRELQQLQYLQKLYGIEHEIVTLREQLGSEARGGETRGETGRSTPPPPPPPPRRPPSTRRARGTPPPRRPCARARRSAARLAERNEGVGESAKYSLIHY